VESTHQGFAMNKRAVGLALMLLASAFFTLGSGWMMDRAYTGNDWAEAHEIGLIMGIPATLLLVIILLLPRVGSFFGVLIAGLTLLFWAPQAVLGDMEERLIWSLTIGTAVYFAGAVLVRLNNRHSEKQHEKGS